MDSDKIKDLLDVEVKIFNYYKQLSSLELFKNYGKEFTILIGLIKDAIKKQNEMLDTLSVADLLSSGDNSYKEYLKNKYNQEVADSIINRTIILCTNKITSVNFRKGCAVLNREQIEAKYIVMSESTSIQLSFIDEYLLQVDDLAIRKMLCDYKYYLIYITGTTIEERLMDNYYHTNKSIYLTSYLEGGLRNIPVNCINEAKKELGTALFDSKFSPLYIRLLSVSPNDIIRYSLYAHDLLKDNIKFRSNLLLLDEDNFLEKLKLFKINKDNPWYNLLLSDRERHKIVTLGQGKIR